MTSAVTLDTPIEPSTTAPVADAAPAPAEPAETFTPRELTANVRRTLGIPSVKHEPYRWPFAILMVAMVALPLALLGWWWILAAVCAFALVVLPALRWVERRDVLLAERVWTHGREVVARIVDIEPGDAKRNKKIVRIEFVATDATGAPKRVSAIVVGAPLARKGLEPGDDVVALFDVSHPQRALIASRIMRDKPKRAARPVPKGGCGGGGCGGGGCGGGGCGGGGCGEGACGAGGCGGC